MALKFIIVKTHNLVGKPVIFPKLLKPSIP